MTTGEDQAQALVADLFRVDDGVLQSCHDLFEREKRELGVERLRAPDMVDHPTPGAGHKPGGGIVWNASDWPAPVSDLDGILQGIFDLREIAKLIDEGGEQPPPLVTDDPYQHFIRCLRGFHVPPLT